MEIAARRVGAMRSSGLPPPRAEAAVPGVTMTREGAWGPGTLHFVGRVLIVVAVVAVAATAWIISDALLLAFGGLLLGIFLRRLALLVGSRTRLPPRVSLTCVIVLLVGAAAMIAWLLGARMSAEFAKFAEQLPQALERLRQDLSETSWGRTLIRGAEETAAAGLERIQSIGWLGELLSRLTGAASFVAAVVTGIVILLFIGIYFAAEPGLYRRGVLALVPGPHRRRIAQVIDRTGDALWRWLLGQLIAMAVIGVLSAVGLLLMGVPAALALGVIAGIAEFVPYLGPVIAALPAMVIAGGQEPIMALWVAVFFVVLQMAEGNIITPLVQKEMVATPPVLVLVAIVAFGLLFGFLGVLLATPLTVVVIVWLRELYVRDALGKRV
jgi:predicted PurR-regulated permease PerM